MKCTFVTAWHSKIYPCSSCFINNNIFLIKELWRNTSNIIPLENILKIIRSSGPDIRKTLIRLLSAADFPNVSGIIFVLVSSNVLTEVLARKPTDLSSSGCAYNLALSEGRNEDITSVCCVSDPARAVTTSPRETRIPPRGPMDRVSTLTSWPVGGGGGGWFGGSGRSAEPTSSWLLWGFAAAARSASMHTKSGEEWNSRCISVILLFFLDPKKRSLLLP